MLIKTLLISSLVSLSPLTAHAANDSVKSDESDSPQLSTDDTAEFSHYHRGGRFGRYSGIASDFCRGYNRDGINCGFVGYGEGQIGSPWGYDAGEFRCVNGCLQWVDPNIRLNSCYAINRDGVTCDQVGYYEGQIGAPWGSSNGQFQCTSGCLQWLGY